MLEEMDPYAALMILSAIVILVSLAGAYIPYLRDMNSRQVHLMVALAAGIFIGILFFMLLPETFDSACHGSEAVPWIAGGFMTVLLVDAILKKRHMNECLTVDCVDREHGHRLTSFSAFIGLAIHAAVDGVLIAIALIEGGEFGIMLVAAVCLHKFADLFALSSTFRLTTIGKRTVIFYMVIFALITPIAAFVSMPAIDIAESMDPLIPLGVAAGMFMYVGLCSLLPEAFHERRDSIISFVLVAAGIIAIALVSLMMGDAHVH
jgi:zinc transporter ZupT